ncbi:putative conjugative transposon mobilization protein BF0132 [Prevotella intermedia]|uniref:Conjugative transposon mobilization protein BF0132 n=1 Tax=Prevotella intermedia TaxID=28131 RepID=A0AAD1F829_PREIN|nr:conjugal transfer protein MobB [Prevotella intermedia]AFJ08745.1 relaxase/mobilization nuclease domain protein [Prevotella intermedia 17]APW33796.1 mobilization protein [Prevotella intermedia]BAR96622.1 putative conjugative transposon mobilization protein BF0132 [Prevotella intermedia]
MVAKINYGSSLFGALAYNGEKVNEGVAKILETNKVFSPADGTHDISACMQDFMAYMPSHVLTKKPVIHISLNPHPDDSLTDEQFSAIAWEYIEKMGYANQPFIVYKHEDIDRHHLHIVTLAVDERGKKINDGNNFYTSTRILKELEQKYGLIPAQMRKEKEVFRLQKVCYGDGENLKKQLASVIKPAAKFYHCPSLKEYRALLSTYNICVEEVKGEIRGKTYMGLLYFATDDKGNKVGKVFKSSLFGKSVGYETLQNGFKASKEKLKEKHLAPKTKAIVAGALKRSATREDFRGNLHHRGIDVIFRENEEGRLYGVTFIDHNNGCVINGSRLGKELSANAIAEWFDRPHPELSVNTPQGENQSASHTLPSEENSFLGGLLDLPIEANGTDWEEEQFRRRMQRKKKQQKPRL